MISLDDVVAAARRLDGVANRTPVLTSRTLDARTGARVTLKAETLQRVGAFKFRGAYNALATLAPAARARGVAAVSSGNHAQAVALAARLHGAPATILMPRDAPAAKLDATRGYGAEVVPFHRYADDRDALLRRLVDDRGLAPVHPYDDERVMAGQGTVALELLDQAGGLDVLVAPVGGGGLLSGCATVGAAHGVRTVGVEPAAGDDFARSVAAGERVAIAPPRTIADGQQTTTPGALTFPVVRARADGIVLVDDAEIAAAMRWALTRLKLVLEPSGACTLAALLHDRVPDVAGARVGVVLSGGNVDPARYAALVAEPAAAAV